MKEQQTKLPLEKRIKYIALATIICIVFFPTIIYFIAMITSARAESRQSLKYKKVVKQGLFWDTTYLIER